MISSPCKTCQKNNQPKENCYKECKLLQAIQELQLAAEGDRVVSASDSFEENSIAIAPPEANILPSFD